MWNLGVRAAAMLLVVSCAAAAGVHAQPFKKGGGGPPPRAAPAARPAPHPAPAMRAMAPRPAPHVAVAPHPMPHIAAPRHIPAPLARPQWHGPAIVRRGPTPHIAVGHSRERIATPHIERRVTRHATAPTHTPRTVGLGREHRTVTTNVTTTRNANSARITNGRHFNTDVRRNRSAMSQALVRAPGGQRALRNQAFAGRSTHDPALRALARRTFEGRFARSEFRADRRGRHRHSHGFVIGWIGPVFWPYAYDDFVDYTFWPVAYDAFWPYAYDDVYDGIFGPYALGATAYASEPASGGRRRATVQRRAGGAVAQVCSEQAAGLTDWPIERIAEAVQPDEAQRAALDNLKDATGQAIAALQSACPDTLPSTPPGRLTAMRTRLEIMLQAVRTIRPALDKFYNSLNDEQKQRFNALDGDQQAQATNRSSDLTKACSGAVTKTGDLPRQRIEQALSPNASQRTALNELAAASSKAAELLKANCSEDQSMTPPGRLAAMEHRLNAMLEAVNTVQPALEAFYNSLSDEQKARFNTLNTPQG